MANTCYDNFFLSNEIEDQYQSHLDLQQFCTVDNNLTGVAGMVRKIHKYKATDGTEKLTMGNGNTKTIEAGYTEKEYRIQMAQNRFQYYDEEAMTDPMVITTGTRGNDLRVVITANENSTEQKPLFDVETFLGTVQVDLQEGVAAITGLKANDYLDWKSSGTLSLTASLPLTGGTNGTVADSDYQTYLDQAEAYTFNAMGCTESKATITALFAAFAKRMRDDVGKKFQVVLFRKLADYEGVVSVKNGLTSDKTSTALIPWVTGVIGGTAVNKSATNMTYDGEYDVDTDFTQTQLENGIREGSFMFHRVDEAVCVLTDINSFISITDEKSSDFSSNQTIRVLDQIANDIAVLFGKKYLGKVPNDAAGRISLWNDIVKHHTELQDIRAIENFSGENVTVEKGDTKKSVVVTDYVTPVNAMEQLYMTVYVQ